MLYIRKSESSKEAGEEISRVKREYKYLLEKRTPESAREAFDHLDKGFIRDSLVKEQHGICAYCMRRIESNIHMTIEHWSPIELEPDRAVDYSNMLGVCNGGREKKCEAYLDDGRRILCCDASKGDRKITISPLNPEHMKLIRYSADGMIYTHPEDETLTTDMNEVLNLNSIILVEGRKQAYESYVRFISGLVKRNKPIRNAIEKEIERLKNKATYDEFAGVVIYFLERKLKRVQ